MIMSKTMREKKRKKKLVGFGFHFAYAWLCLFCVLPVWLWCAQGQGNILGSNGAKHILLYLPRAPSHIDSLV